MPGTVPESSVREFYGNGKIFITGATGFLGKALLEKLLRVCPNVNHIYVLVRMKKGKDPQTRAKEIIDDPLFDALRKERPDFDKKVTCIPGDVGNLRLGMSDNDYDFLTKEVTHVFHSAATVRFNETLKSALQINVRGTREMIAFCKECLHLKIFVHVSTAYSNTHEKPIEEKFFEPPLTAEGALQMTEILLQDKLDALTPELIKPWHNTYAFTKCIAENLVKDQARSLPTVVFRPAIVMGSLKEPVVGWIDNIFGPTGVIVAAGVGLLRTMYIEARAKANIVPVDMTINAMMASAWEVGSNFNNNTVIENSLDVPKDSDFIKHTETIPKIYNFVADNRNSITWGYFINKNLEFGKQIPSKQTIWYYTVTLPQQRIFYQIFIVLFHYIPGALVDGVCLALGKKAQMCKGYKKIHTLTEVLTVFADTKWKFCNDNVLQLWSHLSDVDKKTFDFDMARLDWDSYIWNILLGIRSFILKENDVTLPSAKRRMFMFWLAHRLLQFSLLALCFWALSKIFL